MTDEEWLKLLENIKVYYGNTYCSYKYKLTLGEDKRAVIHNKDNKFKTYKSDDLWIVLWLRTKSEYNNEISYEYGRYCGMKVTENKSSGKSIGKEFVETYCPLENIEELIMIYKVFKKIYEEYKRTNKFPTEKFYQDKIGEEYDKTI